MSDTDQLKQKVAQLTETNTALGAQLKNALGDKLSIEGVQDLLSKLSIQDEAAEKIKQLTAENEKLNSIIQGLQEKLGGLTGMAVGLGAAQNKVSDGQDQAEKAAAEAADDVKEKAEEAANDAASAATNLVKGFGW